MGTSQVNKENGKDAAEASAPTVKGKLCLARVTLLDGTVLDYHAEVCSDAFSTV